MLSTMPPVIGSLLPTLTTFGFEPPPVFTAAGPVCPLHIDRIRARAAVERGGRAARRVGDGEGVAAGAQVDVKLARPE